MGREARQLNEGTNGGLPLEWSVGGRDRVRNLDRAESAFERRQHLTRGGQQDRHVSVCDTVLKMSEPQCARDRIDLGSEALVPVDLERRVTRELLGTMRGFCIDRYERARGSPDLRPEPVRGRQHDALGRSELVVE